MSFLVTYVILFLKCFCTVEAKSHPGFQKSASLPSPQMTCSFRDCFLYGKTNRFPFFLCLSCGFHLNTERTVPKHSSTAKYLFVDREAAEKHFIQIRATRQMGNISLLSSVSAVSGDVSNSLTG